MNKLFFLIIFLAGCVMAFSQTAARTIYDTELEFAKMAAEKGMKSAFLEYLAPDGIMFDPDPKNGIELWRSQPESDALLTWNPLRIDVSSNGAIGYSIGNSIYHPNGKNGTEMFYGHYLTIWSRRGDKYRAVVDTGIRHAKPAVEPKDWRSSGEIASDANKEKISAADSSLEFYETVTKRGAPSAYGGYLADDVFLMRDGYEPFIGKKAALDHIKKENRRITFAKRKSFFEAADLAYVTNIYALIDKAGKEFERGNFVQIWKFREGKWKIAAEIFVPSSKASK